MTYNHEETKVRDPSAAKEVERLRNVISEAYIRLVLEMRGPGDGEELEDISDLLYENADRDSAP